MTGEVITGHRGCERMKIILFLKSSTEEGESLQRTTTQKDIKEIRHAKKGGNLK